LRAVGLCRRTFRSLWCLARRSPLRNAAVIARALAILQVNGTSRHRRGAGRRDLYLVARAMVFVLRWRDSLGGMDVETAACDHRRVQRRFLRVGGWLVTGAGTARFAVAAKRQLFFAESSGKQRASLGAGIIPTVASRHPALARSRCPVAASDREGARDGIGRDVGLGELGRRLVLLARRLGHACDSRGGRVFGLRERAADSWLIIWTEALTRS